MKLASRLLAIVLLIPSSVLAFETFFVLNRDGTVARIAADGSSASRNNTAPGGDGFAIDAGGNFIIANSVLVMVTPGGTATTIASPPSGGQFIDVCIDANGNYIVADNGGHKLWRVSAATHQATTIASYPADPNQLEDVFVRVDAAGNYIVAEDSDSQLHLFRITPGGTVTAIALSGASAISVGGLTFDASGNYVIEDYNSAAIDVVTPAGVVTRLIQNSTFAAAQLAGIARDPGTGKYIVAGRLTNSLFAVAPDGSGFVQFFSGAPLSAPVGVIETGGAPTTPAPVSVTPNGGGGASASFTFTFSDTGGWQNFSVVNVLINSVLDGRRACYIAFAPSGPAAGTVFLVDDSGDSGGPYSTAKLPGSGTAQNGQCSIAAGQSSVQASGTTLTLTLGVSFTQSFAGNHVVYMAAGEPLVNSGWQALGTWNVPGPTPSGPSVTGMTPAARASGATQTYTFTFNDPLGWQDIAVANVLVNSAIDGRNACYLAYVPAGASTGLLDLVDNAGDAGGPFFSTVIPGAGVAANTQCTAGSSATVVSAGGTTLTLTIRVTFNHSFSGNQVIYAALRSNTASSGWQAVGSIAVP